MTYLSSSQRSALSESGCEVRTDALSRTLYATDASIYHIEPRAVAFPRDTSETAAVLRAASDSGLSITPRGAGTGLAGGAIGDGLVVDLARHSRWIDGLDLERRTVRVGAGVVLDQLNRHLEGHGLWFGPDVATSSRATLGGMIANNSSGAYAPVYGTTVDHVAALEVVLADGTVATVGRAEDGLVEIRNDAADIVQRHEAIIGERLPSGLVKRWHGYGFADALRSPGDLSRLVCGSEGTLAAVTSAVLEVVPRPRRRGLVVLHFSSVVEAMEATQELLGVGAAAIEHLDRILFDQTRFQRGFARARALLGLDESACEAMLLVEFFDDVDDRLAELEARPLGLRRLSFKDPDEQALVWSVRRAGLSLLTGCPGSAKPTTCIEDVCVRPEQLADYVAGLREILDRLGLEASFYGHAASGELHVRPALDLHRRRDLVRLRQVSDEVSDLCRRFSGSIAAEHGLGIARTEYLAEHLGPELAAASRDLKRLFDPKGLMNPGKVVDDGRYRIDTDLRLGVGSILDTPFRETLGFVDKDLSFVGNLEQCNGCGGCRKDAATMCPTFIASGDEIQSTRGRANTIRAALEGRFGPDLLRSRELAEALKDCLGCKACRTECPSNVDLAALKAELLHARGVRHGAAAGDRLIAAADLLGRIGTLAPAAANRALRMRPLRRLLERRLGVAAGIALPAFARGRFDRWFVRRARPPAAPLGRVLLWDDTWVRYHEPAVGRAAVAVLEAAGYSVELVRGRRCCGRPAASRGLLGEALRLGRHNLSLLRGGDDPVVFLEPSCYSMFVDDYRQLGIDGADEVAARCVLFEELVSDLLDRAPTSLHLDAGGSRVAVHGHCHAKALSDVERLPWLLRRLAGAPAELLPSGCCGMAGAFGVMRETRALSLKVARPLVEMIEALPEGTVVVASGTSCRQQIRGLTAVEPLHTAELLARALR